MAPINLTIYNEFIHERKNELVGKIYPDGIHETIAAYMRQQPGLEVRTATLDMPEHGLSESVLESTDVLMWWGHAAHNAVSKEPLEVLSEKDYEAGDLDHPDMD